MPGGRRSRRAERRGSPGRRSDANLVGAMASMCAARRPIVHGSPGPWVADPREKLSGRKSGRARLAAALRALTLGHLSACAYPRLESAPEATWAFDRPGDTRLGQYFEPVLAPHPEESGLYVLGSGLDAFAARIGLI